MINGQKRILLYVIEEQEEIVPFAKNIKMVEHLQGA